MDDATADGEGPPDGLVTVRGALYGAGLLWLAAVAGFGALQAVAYGVVNSPAYLLLAVGAASLSVVAGYASLRAFGLK
jgi:CHASE2 domain-containing sensor protein